MYHMSYVYSVYWLHIYYPICFSYQHDREVINTPMDLTEIGNLSKYKDNVYALFTQALPYLSIKGSRNSV